VRALLAYARSCRLIEGLVARSHWRRFMTSEIPSCHEPP
jgi:hypothetical protein